MDIIKNNKKLITLGLVFFAVLVLVLAVLLQQSNKGFRLVETIPPNNSTITPQQADITFRFSEPLSEADRSSVLVSVNPNIDHLFKYKQPTPSDITVSLTDLLLSDTQVYEIKIKNITGESGSRLEELAINIIVDLPADAKNLLASLPYDKLDSAGYRIDLLADDVVVVTANNRAALSRGQDHLRSVGISADRFKISSVILNAADIPDWIKESGSEVLH